LGSGYDSNFSLDGQHNAQNESGIGTAFPGFNWTAVLRPDRVRAVLSTLAGEGLVNVLSSPSVMVLDNQTAEIQVGREAPVATSQQQGISSTDRVVNQIQYRSTGVKLSVQPRVTPGRTGADTNRARSQHRLRDRQLIPQLAHVPNPQAQQPCSRTLELGHRAR